MRQIPTRTQYVFLGVLGVSTLVVGVLVSVAIAVIGALVGVRDRSRSPSESRAPSE